MTLSLYAHPFSSYCQKVLIPLYENNTPFEFRMLPAGDQAAVEELGKLWPFKKFPVLVDNGRAVTESSIIIEHLDLYHAGPVRMIPADARAALDVRFMDRFFDTYVSTPMQRLVSDAIRPAESRDAIGVAEARKMLDTAYAWLEKNLQGHEWAVGNTFTMADCAAAPALFYADWSHRIGPQFKNVHAYRQRLLARPSFARAVDEARQYRHFFPLGAPDRD